jgi:hypothetical protein
VSRPDVRSVAVVVILDHQSMETIVKIMCCAVSCFAVLSATRAWATIDIPPACQASTFTVYGYQSGYNQGTSLTNRAWSTIHQSCDELELLSAAIIDNLQSYKIAGNSTYLICRHAGVVNAVFQRLNEIWEQCAGDCCLEGETIGQLSGQLYCQLSILLNGLAKPDDFIRLPVYMCGFAFETCCDAQFIDTTYNYVGLNMMSQPVACSPNYTDEPYYTVWDQTREIQCNYTPPPDPAHH